MEKTMRERLIRVIGSHYDGDADPVETPNNWARAEGAVDAMLAELVNTNSAMLAAASYPNALTGAQCQAVFAAMIGEVASPTTGEG
jgi:hypothetical protein